MFITNAYADTKLSPGFDVMSLLPIALIFLVMYFLVFRPQQKRTQAIKDVMANLKKGDQVLTSSGIIGRIDRLGDQEVLLEISDSVRIRVLKSTITDIYQPKKNHTPETKEPRELVSSENKEKMRKTPYRRPQIRRNFTNKKPTEEKKGE
jgi:preprotein translocase subunit YajC